MRKTIISIVVCMCIIPSVIYAHVSGAFGDFLAGLQDENSDEKLKNEINETKKEIEELTPIVDKMSEKYNKNESIATDKLVFYTHESIDTFSQFLLEEKDVLSMLSNKKIIENNIDYYLEDLNTLYLQYSQLKTTKETMEGHEEVLKMIQGNLDSKQKLIKEYHIDNLKGEQRQETIATVLGFLWNKEVAKFDEIITSDTKFLKENASVLYSKKDSTSPYKLNDTTLNEHSELTYHFRSDHVYIHFKGETTDVILISTIQKDKFFTSVFKLNFEAGFINGYRLPDSILKQFLPFSFDLNGLNSEYKFSYSEQGNGFVLFKTEKDVME